MNHMNSSTSTHAGAWFAGRQPTHAEIYMLSRQMQSDFLAEVTVRAVRSLFRATRLGPVVSKLAARVRRWHGRRSTVAELRRLDDRTLQDIGIDPYDIEGTVASLMDPAQDQSRAHLGDVIRGIDGGMTGALKHHDLCRRAEGNPPLGDLDGADSTGHRLSEAAANRNAPQGRQAAASRAASR